MECFLKQMLTDVRGTAAVEYGIICAMIVIGLVSVVAGLATETSNMWNNVASMSKDAIDKAR